MSPDIYEVSFIFNKIDLNQSAGLKRLEANLASNVALRQHFLRLPAIYLRQAGVPVPPQKEQDLQRLALRTALLPVMDVGVRIKIESDNSRFNGKYHVPGVTHTYSPSPRSAGQATGKRVHKPICIEFPYD